MDTCQLWLLLILLREIKCVSWGESSSLQPQPQWRFQRWWTERKRGWTKRKKKRQGHLSLYTPAPPKQADPRGRAAAAICLRCGQVGHTTATCPVQAKQGVKRSSPTESMAKHDEAMVIFVDILGQERVDCAMMDPGASAFLCGYGPFKRYIEYT